MSQDGLSSLRKQARSKKLTAPSPGDGPDISDLPEMEELPEESMAEESHPSAAAAADKFQKYAAMRRDPNAAIVPVRKRLVSLSVRPSPHRDWFIRVSTHPEHRGRLPLFWDKGADGIAYLVAAEALAFLPHRVSENDCVLTITRQGSWFLWCSPMENEQGEWNSWHASAYDMKEVATTSWIRVVGNRQINGYEPIEPVAAITQEPVFPENLVWLDVIKLAFRRRHIENETHPVVARILGQG
jgi:hypothetical protein